MLRVHRRTWVEFSVARQENEQKEKKGCGSEDMRTDVRANLRDHTLILSAST